MALPPRAPNRRSALPAFARPDALAPWRPGPELLADSRPARLVRASEMPDLEALQARAVADPAWFWGLAVDDLELAWGRRWDRVLDLDAGIEWPRWWVGGAFDHAAAVLERWATRPDDEAIAWEGDDGSVRRVTGRELIAAVEATADRFAAHGIGTGTRVGVFLPMLPETAVTVLTLGRLRAVFTPIFSGYAGPAVATRLRAFQATHLVTADGFLRRGRAIAMASVVAEALADSPSIRRVLVVRRLEPDGLPTALSDPVRDAAWDRGPNAVQRASLPAAPRLTGPVDPETPYMVIYTSGTTGAPKGTVHVHGGFPIKAAQDLAHTFDLRPGDALCWITDLGWMMGPWAISGALLVGARLVMFEGAPDHPDAGRVWSLVERHRITHLGVSPTLIRALLVQGDEPVRDHDRRSLRILGSTGEPWNPDPWTWLFETVGEGRLPIVNYSGGTEISGGIVGATPLRPIRPTSFNGPCVGMAAEIVDPSGRPVVDEVGELAIRAPWPGMTRGFWGGSPSDRERYLEAYWRRLPGTWVHGDWAARDSDGFWYLHGRSDDTLKIAGKRVGPAELEAVAVAHPAVVEAAAIGVPDELHGEVAVLLVVVRNDTTVEPETLAREVGDQVAHGLGKPLRPAAVVVVPDLPRTRSGKIMRRVARAAWLGQDPGDLTALENADAVTAIGKLGAGARGDHA